MDEKIVVKKMSGLLKEAEADAALDKVASAAPAEAPAAEVVAPEAVKTVDPSKEGDDGEPAPALVVPPAKTGDDVTAAAAKSVVTSAETSTTLAADHDVCLATNTDDSSATKVAVSDAVKPVDGLSVAEEAAVDKLSESLAELDAMVKSLQEEEEAGEKEADDCPDELVKACEGKDPDIVAGAKNIYHGALKDGKSKEDALKGALAFLGNAVAKHEEEGKPNVANTADGKAVEAEKEKLAAETVQEDDDELARKVVDDAAAEKDDEKEKAEPELEKKAEEPAAPAPDAVAVSPTDAVEADKASVLGTVSAAPDLGAEQPAVGAGVLKTQSDGSDVSGDEKVSDSVVGTADKKADIAESTTPDIDGAAAPEVKAPLESGYDLPENGVPSLADLIHTIRSGADVEDDHEVVKEDDEVAAEPIVSGAQPVPSTSAVTAPTPAVAGTEAPVAGTSGVVDKAQADAAAIKVVAAGKDVADTTAPVQAPEKTVPAPDVDYVVDKDPEKCATDLEGGQAKPGDEHTIEAEVKHPDEAAKEAPAAPVAAKKPAEETEPEEKKEDDKEVASLKEALALGTEYYKDAKHKEKLEEQLAVYVAGQNDDRLYEEYNRLLSEAAALKEAIVKKYSVVAAHRTDDLLESLDVATLKIQKAKGLFKRLNEDVEVVNAEKSAKPLSLDKTAFN